MYRGISSGDVHIRDSPAEMQIQQVRHTHKYDGSSSGDSHIGAGPV